MVPDLPGKKQSNAIAKQESEVDQTSLKTFSAADLADRPLVAPRKLCGVIYDSTPVRVRGEPLGAVWWQGRQWAVTSDGIEARDGSYVIEAGRVIENLEPYSWVRHMAAKNWVDLEDFATAWLVAVALHTSARRAALKKAVGVGE